MSDNRSSSLSPYDQTYLSVAYAKQATQCQACGHAVLRNHIKVGYVRYVMTSRFPCIKTHWYHPLCVPAYELQLIEKEGNLDGKPFTIASPCVGAERLTLPDQQHLRALLVAIATDSPSHGSLQLPLVFTAIGPHMRSSKKRRREKDEEFTPGDRPGAAKRRFAGACRAAIQDSIATFKRDYFSSHANADGQVPCALTGIPVDSATAHVDHAPPSTFDAIVEGYILDRCQQEKMSRSRLLTQTEFVAGRFFDHRVARSFQAYHTSRSQLRILASRTNLTLPRKPSSRTIIPCVNITDTSTTEMVLPSSTGISSST